MKYWGERTKALYDTVEACERAEFEAKEAENREKIRKERELALKKEQEEKALAEQKAKAAERKEAAAKVEAARKVMVEAQNAYRKELEAFCAKFGSYHWTSKSINDIPTLFSDFWNLFS